MLKLDMKNQKSYNTSLKRGDYKVIDTVHNVWQGFIYGVLNRRPSIDLSEIPTEVHFKQYFDKKNKVYWIEAKELPDFIVSGKNQTELARNFHETMMVYFDVPTYFAKKLNPTIRINITNHKTKQNEELNVNYREELNKVLA